MSISGKNFNPSIGLIKLFLVFILTGTFLLKLPAATVEPVTVTDALFTATSAVCVTGLTVQDTANFFTGFGQGVILILIQLGALGYMTFASLLVMLLGRGMSIKGRILVQQQVSGTRSTKLSTFLLRVALFTGALEIIGAGLLFWRFRSILENTSDALYFGVFHSISAFCNAGFDVFGGGVSLTPVREDPVTVLTFAMLIILGGLGYIVLNDGYEYARARLKRKKYRVSVHTKIVLRMSLVLLLAGTAAFFFAESGNPRTLSGMSFPHKLLNSFFISVTPRTAGFNMVDTAGLINFSLILTIILMFIGASPGGTGGGIKTTTVAVLFGNISSIIKEERDVAMFKRRIAISTVKNSVAIFSISVAFIVGVVLLLTVFEPHSVESIIFEATSAFGTVGLSRGITPELSDTGKLLITLSMFFGRLGPLAVVSAVLRRKSKPLYRYPEQDVAVG